MLCLPLPARVSSSILPKNGEREFSFSPFASEKWQEQPKSTEIRQVMDPTKLIFYQGKVGQLSSAPSAGSELGMSQEG